MVPETVRRLIAEAIEAAGPRHLPADHVALRENTLFIKDEAFSLDAFPNLHVLGAGKGAVSFFHGLDEIMGRRIAGGVVVSVEAHRFKHPRVHFYPGSHPLPGPLSLTAGKALMDYIGSQVAAEDLVIFLLTGGASALATLPAPPLELSDKTETTRQLLASGAGIEEINCVRKHLSAIKGGRLAEAVYPARLVSLILSDIIGSPLEAIGSGPSVGDSTSFADALHILSKYRLVEKIPPSVTALLERGKQKKVPDTPPPGDPRFKRNRHFILGDNTTALEAAHASAEKQGLPAHILTAADRGEARETATHYAAMLKEVLSVRHPFQPPVLLLSGGELTVTLKGNGQGGRNQEFVLAMLKELKDVDRPFFVLSMGTDGIDGPTDAAGAWIDHRTMKKVNRLNLDIDTFLDTNNSYAFFDTIGQLYKTGPTGTNVMDIRVFYLPGTDAG